MGKDGESVSETELAVGIHGAAGRMGIRLIQLIVADPALRLAAALERAEHPGIGSDVGPIVGTGPLGVPLSSVGEFGGPVDVMIDFSHPTAAMALAEFCSRRRIPLVVGTTGFETPQRQSLEGLAREIPLLISPNMSRAVNLLMRLVGEAARALGPSADIEIVERHHRLKKDAPSGTALKLADVVGKAIESSQFVYGRHGQVGERPRGEIGVHAVREGDNPGEHTVIFGLPGESLELSHRALNRDGFARGALDAACFLAGKPPGLYAMADVLDAVNEG
jgi:4-hydroxy-tetrahydrodipicolinate reductase